jgi:CRP-like cAMP-binding protein
MSVARGGSSVSLEHNILLDLLGDRDRSLIAPLLEPVQLEVRQTLFGSDAYIEHVYFPLGGLSSEIGRAEDGDEVELACVGKEGLSGLPVLLGVESSPHYAFVQVAGPALRIRSADLKRLMDECASLRELLLRYAHFYAVQIASSAIADARFTIEQRLARWLLMALDRVGNPVQLTHGFLSLMLAVRRSGVTSALHILEGDRLIKADRALITILDRDGLVERARGCYGLPEKEYQRVFGTALTGGMEFRKVVRPS